MTFLYRTHLDVVFILIFQDGCNSAILDNNNNNWALYALPVKSWSRVIKCIAEQDTSYSFEETFLIIQKLIIPINEIR